MKRRSTEQAGLPVFECLTLAEKLSLFFRVDWRSLVEAARNAGEEHAQATTCAMVGLVLINRSDADGLVRLFGRRATGMELVRVESQTEEKTCRRAMRFLKQRGLVVEEAMGRLRVSWSRLRELAGDAEVAPTDSERGRSDCPPAESALVKQERPEVPPERPDCPVAGPDCPSGADILTVPPIKERARGPHFPPEPSQSPQQPEGGGGADESERERAVLDAYPGPGGSHPHPDAVRGLDLAALRQAVRNEQDRRTGEPEPVTIEEILAAVLALAAMKPANPLRPRKWLAERGYMDFVRAARTRTARAGRRPSPPVRQPVVEPPSTQLSDADAMLATLDAEAVASLVSEAISRQPAGSMIRETWERAVRGGGALPAMLRLEMASIARERSAKGMAA